MIKKYLAIIFILLIVMFRSKNIFCQIYKSNHWNLAAKNAKVDSVNTIERLAAFKFNTKINNYRKEKGLPVLQWDEALWLAARNHSVWMNVHNKLMHAEMENTTFFSGKTPNDRIAYVLGNSNYYSFTGENALYNFSAYGETINEIAENISEESFNDWKNSHGHNSNMLNNFNIHGVAFIISERKVWATDLLSKSNRYYIENGNALFVYDFFNTEDEKKSLKEEAPTLKKNKYNSTTASHIRKDILLKTKNFFSENSELRLSNKYNTLAKVFADKLIQNKKLNKDTDEVFFSSEKIKKNTLIEKNIFTRLLHKRMYLLKTEILIEKEKHLFDIALVEKEILDVLKKQNMNLTTGNIGYFVNVKQNNNVYKIAFVCLMG
jgi:uncharacterized protein YkwD